jgi:hypothetical protein
MAARTGSVPAGGQVPVAAPAVGYGVAPDPADEQWQTAAEGLTPQESLSRINANARATVGAVTLIGTLLTGLGLLSAQALPTEGPTRGFALAAAAAAGLSVLLALLYLALRLERLNVADIEQIKGWYKRQFRRARLAVLASWLLILAVVLAAVTAVLGLAPVGRPEPALGLRMIGIADKRTVTADVAVSGLHPGALVVVRVVGLAADACPEVVLLDSRNRADQSGKVAVSSSIGSLPCNSAFRLDVEGDAVVPGSLTVP